MLRIGSRGLSRVAQDAIELLTPFANASDIRVDDGQQARPGSGVSVPESLYDARVVILDELLSGAPSRRSELEVQVVPIEP